MSSLKDDSEGNMLQLSFENINEQDSSTFEEQNHEIIEIKDDFQTVTYTRYGGYLIYTTMIQTLFKEVFEYTDNSLELKNTSKTWDVKNLIYTYIMYFFMGISCLTMEIKILEKDFLHKGD